jgi:hypothetical protein
VSLIVQQVRMVSGNWQPARKSLLVKLVMSSVFETRARSLRADPSDRIQTTSKDSFQRCISQTLSFMKLSDIRNRMPGSQALRRFINGTLSIKKDPIRALEVTKDPRPYHKIAPMAKSEPREERRQNSCSKQRKNSASIYETVVNSYISS